MVSTMSVSQTQATQVPLDAPPPQIVVLQMITGYWVSQSIFAAARLGIADRLKDQPKHYTDLAVSTGSHAPSLFRLLRALAGIGLVRETEPSVFELTPLGETLRSDVPGSLRDVSIMMGDPEHYNSWGNILHSLKTGQSGFEGLFGKNVFEYYAENPEPAAVFDRAMTSFSGVENAAIAAEYDFSRINTLVDVAGGHGSTLLSILQANPHMKGILFDQPDVIERATPIIAKEANANRCQLITGSFFESVPAGGDAYTLKHILHDWDDERSIAILKRCREAMVEQGRVLVIEQVIPPGNDPFIGKLLDMNMLVMCPGGKERTEAEYRQIFEAAGLRLKRIVPTSAFVSVVEGVPI
jgi:hypothetical protein